MDAMCTRSILISIVTVVSQRTSCSILNIVTKVKRLNTVTLIKQSPKCYVTALSEYSDAFQCSTFQLEKKMYVTFSIS